MAKFYIGIDPGWQGGMAVIKDMGSEIKLRCYKSPSSDCEFPSRIIREKLLPYRDTACFCVIEEIRNWGKDDEQGGPNFVKMVQSFHFWVSQLETAHIPFDIKATVSWKAPYPKPPKNGVLPKPEKAGKERRNKVLLLMEEKPMDYGPKYKDAEKKYMREVKRLIKAERDRRKAHYKAECVRMFGSESEITNWNTDAIMIANYARYMDTGEIDPGTSQLFA